MKISVVPRQSLIVCFWMLQSLLLFSTAYSQLPDVVSVPELVNSLNTKLKEISQPPMSEKDVVASLLNGLASQELPARSDAWGRDLRHFLETLANQNRLTLPVAVKVFDLGEEYSFTAEDGEFSLSGPSHKVVKLRIYKKPSGDILDWMEVNVRLITTSQDSSVKR